jgi:hypothetical protein
MRWLFGPVVSTSHRKLRNSDLIQSQDELSNSSKKPLQESVMSRPKTVCPITREKFLSAGPGQAGEVRKKLEELPFEAREFSTGAFGWNSNGKITVMVDGIPVRCQVGLNVTVIGSKEAAADAAAA